MRNTRLAALRHIITFGLVLTACGVEEREDDFVPRAGALGGPTLQDAYWAVATLDDPIKGCPDLSGQSWASQGDRMFLDGSMGLAAQETFPGSLPPSLGGFCLYQWNGALGAPVLPTHIDIRHVSLDWAVTEALGNGLESAYRPELRNVFLSQVDRLWEHAPKPQHTVTVAVVDSESEYGEGMPYIEHASTMASVIETLACPWQSDCPVDVYRALALPLLETGAHRPDGGYYGTRADVAMGIVESVLAWRKQMEEGGGDSRLVINLSLGWVTEGTGACGADESDPWCESGTTHTDELVHWLNTPSPLAYSGQVANEAVHAALLFATCQGALVVAAAGNEHEDSCNQAPMAPAVWSRYGSPSLTECLDLGFEAPPNLPGAVFDTDRPLVQPVSAVNHEDDPIFLTRPNGETRLAAPGYMVTTSDGMDPLTGTSLSAAVASAGAALLWSFDSMPSPGTVVDRLYGTGTSLERTSEMNEFGWGSGVPMRRISLCQAVDPSCPGGGESCESEYCHPENSVGVARNELYNQVAQHVGQIQTVSASASGLVTDTCSSCGDPITAMLPNTTSTQDYYFFSSCGASPSAFVPQEGPTLAGPQPEVPPCPDCPLVVTTTADDSTAILALDSWYWNKNIQGVLLTLSRQGHPPTTMDLSSINNLIPNLRSGAMVRVTLPGIWHSENEPMRMASMGVLVEDDGAVHFRSNEMLIIAD